MADSLVVSASHFRVPFPPKLKYDVGVKYRPSVLENIKHWKVFEDDNKIKMFLESVDEFFALLIDHDPVSKEKLDTSDFLSNIAECDIV